MDTITIICIVTFLLTIIYNVHKNIIERNQQIEDSYTEDWQQFVKYVERKHILYRYDEETTEWIIDNKDLEWKIIKRDLPENIKNQFYHFIATNHPKIWD